VLEAVGGGDGLARARQEHPQVIFLDLVMPGLSGYEVLDQLKADPGTRGIPVIIHTSKMLSEEERDELMRMCTVIVSKDTSSAQAALVTVQQALERAGMVPAGGQP